VKSAKFQIRCLLLRSDENHVTLGSNKSSFITKPKKNTYDQNATDILCVLDCRRGRVGDRLRVRFGGQEVRRCPGQGRLQKSPICRQPFEVHVDYRDSSTGEIIANPDFWKGNNAWSGGGTWGQSDNQIRDAVVGQIMFYTLANK